jgi:putative FmdB family regulatory protein
MPLYEYRCHKCGNVFEVMQKFVDEPVKVHADCGGEVEKLISRSAFQLKGSGWYVTDYAKSGATKEPKSGKSESGGNADTKSDTKSGDSKSSDSKSSDSKSSGSDSKSSDSSSSGSSSGGSGASTPSSSTSSSSSDTKT